MTNIYFVEENLPFTDKLSSDTLFSDYANLWISENQNSLSPKTLSRYKSLLCRINMGIGHLSLSKITAHHLNLFYQKLGQEGANLRNGKKLSDKTILHHHRLISVILQSATREGIITVNPASRDSIKTPSAQSTEVTPYQIEDVRKLISSFDDMNIKWRTITILLLTTGIRRGELLGLTWNDIDTKNKIISINKNVVYTPESGIVVKSPKTKKSIRLIKYEDKLLHTAIVSYKSWYESFYGTTQKGSYLFPSENMTVMHPDTVTKYITRHCSKHNLKHCTPHKLRHTYVSMMIALNMPIKEISTNVGHAQLTTTCNIYAHQIARQQAKALAPIESLIYNNVSRDTL